MSRLTQNRPKKYQKVSDEIRNLIIQKLYQEHLTQLQVSEELDVPLSTVKAVKRVYREEGRISTKKKRLRKKSIISTVIVAVINSNNLPFDMSQIHKYVAPYVSIEKIESENAQEVCMQKGAEQLLGILNQIQAQNLPNNHYSKQLLALLQEYTDKCQQFQQ